MAEWPGDRFFPKVRRMIPHRLNLDMWTNIAKLQLNPSLTALHPVPISFVRMLDIKYILFPIMTHGFHHFPQWPPLTRFVARFDAFTRYTYRTFSASGIQGWPNSVIFIFTRFDPWPTPHWDWKWWSDGIGPWHISFISPPKIFRRPNQLNYWTSPQNIPLSVIHCLWSISPIWFRPSNP